MIKTIVTPQNNSLLLAIPNKYIGKEIEILFYAKEEVIEQTAKILMMLHVIKVCSPMQKPINLILI
ncbi:MAG: hypothetical protein IPP29_05790 [Bacteroidetes bacterium]|nr:hypothetical protein [Bacteroidota bacterium]